MSYINENLTNQTKNLTLLNEECVETIIDCRCGFLRKQFIAKSMSAESCEYGGTFQVLQGLKDEPVHRHCSLSEYCEHFKATALLTLR